MISGTRSKAIGRNAELKRGRFRTTRPRAGSRRDTEGRLKKVLAELVKMEHPACVTCGRSNVRLDASHFFRRVNKRVAYDRRNLHPQCRRCHGRHDNDQAPYRAWMVAKYGEGVVSELDRERWNVLPLEDGFLEGLLAHYERRLESLKLIAAAAV